MKLKVLIILLLNILCLYSREQLKISIVDLNYELKNNSPLRKDIVRTINRFPYLKHPYTITVDRMKKRLFKTNELTLEQGLTVASNLKVNVAIIMDSELKLKNTNDVLTNNLATNNITNIFLTNENIQSYSNDIVNTLDKLNNYTQEKKELNDIIEEKLGNPANTNNTSETNEYELFYNFTVVDITKGETIKEYKSISSNQANSQISTIGTYLEYYFAKSLLDSLTNENSNINLNFEIERITSSNESIIIKDSGEMIENETFKISFNSTEDGYLYILALQNDGNIILMHPNDFNNYMENNNIQKNNIDSNIEYTIPPENSIFKMVVSAPFGLDSFYAIFIKNEAVWLEEQYFSGEGFKSGNKNRLAEMVIKLKSSLKLKLSNDWQISKIYITSKPEI
ncbi:DUF4384 domain-containing protein [uncultured Brachyspira sp.]|uniref:DUF4384 domain-containing protein n=1 Tax=uncultured Brachyspira sp. TaxID=221953 RepID=UPI0025DB35CD|nr:DUF4384 domain-containing protein [uncultured Brachyspira sp.]